MPSLSEGKYQEATEILGQFVLSPPLSTFSFLQLLVFTLPEYFQSLMRRDNNPILLHVLFVLTVHKTIPIHSLSPWLQTKNEVTGMSC